MISLQDHIDEEEAQAIVEKCAYSPLAITVVSELLRSKKFTPFRLIQNLELDSRNIAKGLGVVECIKRGVDNLDEEMKTRLVCLSVFQSSPFSKRYAKYVCGQEGESENEVWGKVSELERKHLIEKEAVSGKRSLQPLVYQYITAWKKPKHLKDAEANATKQFIKLLENTVGKITKKLSTSAKDGLRKMENEKVHILKFYDLMADHPDVLPEAQKRMSEKDAVLKKRVSDLADILLCNAKKRRLFKVHVENLKGRAS